MSEKSKVIFYCWPQESGKTEKLIALYFEHYGFRDEEMMQQFGPKDPKSNVVKVIDYGNDSLWATPWGDYILSPPGKFRGIKSLKANMVVDDRCDVSSFGNSFRDCELAVVDDAHLLTIRQAKRMVKEATGGKVLCFGTYADGDGEVYEASEFLFGEADKVINFPGTCNECEEHGTNFTREWRSIWYDSPFLGC